MCQRSREREEKTEKENRVSQIQGIKYRARMIKAEKRRGSQTEGGEEKIDGEQYAAHARDNE